MMVCLCGSTRFLDDLNKANQELTLRGISVVTISMVLPKNEQEQEDQGKKVILDLVHLEKILRSDGIYIVGDGYVGFSTAREILWARMLGKAIVMQSDNWDEDMVMMENGEQSITALSLAYARLGI